jgi:hypothetical protein
LALLLKAAELLAVVPAGQLLCNQDGKRDGSQSEQGCQQNTQELLELPPWSNTHLQGAGDSPYVVLDTPYESNEQSLARQVFVRVS